MYSKPCLDIRIGFIAFVLIFACVVVNIGEWATDSDAEIDSDAEDGSDVEEGSDEDEVDSDDSEEEEEVDSDGSWIDVPHSSDDEEEEEVGLFIIMQSRYFCSKYWPRY